MFFRTMLLTLWLMLVTLPRVHLHQQCKGMKVQHARFALSVAIIIYRYTSPSRSPSLYTFSFFTSRSQPIDRINKHDEFDDECSF